MLVILTRKDLYMQLNSGFGSSNNSTPRSQRSSGAVIIPDTVVTADGMSNFSVDELKLMFGNDFYSRFFGACQQLIDISAAEASGLNVPGDVNDSGNFDHNDIIDTLAKLAEENPEAASDIRDIIFGTGSQVFAPGSDSEGSLNMSTLLSGTFVTSQENADGSVNILTEGPNGSKSVTVSALEDGSGWVVTDNYNGEATGNNHYISLNDDGSANVTSNVDGNVTNNPYPAEEPGIIERVMNFLSDPFGAFSGEVAGLDVITNKNTGEVVATDPNSGSTYYYNPDDQNISAFDKEGNLLSTIPASDSASQDVINDIINACKNPLVNETVIN